MSPLFTWSRKACTATLFATFCTIGCGCDDEKAAPTPAAAPAVSTTPPPATQPLIAMPKMIDWCREHGMPESICVQCNESLVASYKAKGDWDEQHSVPKSQCFKCDPSLKEKFAAAYKAQHGTEPPTGGADNH